MEHVTGAMRKLDSRVGQAQVESRSGFENTTTIALVIRIIPMALGGLAVVC